MFSRLYIAELKKMAEFNTFEEKTVMGTHNSSYTGGQLNLKGQSFSSCPIWDYSVGQINNQIHETFFWQKLKDLYSFEQ